MEKFRIHSAAHLSHCWAETSFGDSSAHIGLRLSQPPRESMVVELWGAEWRWKGQLDFLITFVWYSSCLLVWLLVIGRIWERFIENETFVVNYWSTFWGGSGGVCTLWRGACQSWFEEPWCKHCWRKTRPVFLRLAAGLVCRIHTPRIYEINNLMYILVLHSLDELGSNQILKLSRFWEAKNNPSQWEADVIGFDQTLSCRCFLTRSFTRPCL